MRLYFCSGKPTVFCYFLRVYTKEKDYHVIRHTKKHTSTMPGTKRSYKKKASKSKRTFIRAAAFNPAKGRGLRTGTRNFAINPNYSIWNAKSAFANLNPFPVRKFATLRYVESGVANVLVGGIGGTGGTEHTFTLGSLFDPALTLTGHQPYFFDQMSAIYQRYRVNAVTIKITAYDPTTPGSVLGWQIDSWNGSAGTLTGVSPQTIKERPQTGFLQPNTTFDKEMVILPRIDIARIEGLTRAEHRANVEDYAAAVTASPARSPYLRLAMFNTEGNNAAQMYYHIEMLFECEFWNRQVVAMS